ncbi:DUF1016 N-terminal domain-containing protein [Kribbella sp. NPDC006257]|uniref:DUF1016 N-terminal domain-containing protein n=1 Tax=Kribbella sp. NPDC006257 TaxID=3156738 RepID=UPI0033A89087
MPDWYPDLLDSVASHITTGHRRAITAANTEMLATYWSIGQEILARQHREGWGTKVIARLSADLKDRFPTAKGYSPRNLRYMRTFAVAWPDPPIGQRCAAQLPWRHHMVLMDKLDTADLRLWYAETAIEHGWSRDVLALQIDTGFSPYWCSRCRLGVEARGVRITEAQGTLGMGLPASRDSVLACTSSGDLNGPHGGGVTMVGWSHHDQPGRLTARADFLSRQTSRDGVPKAVAAGLRADRTTCRARRRRRRSG